MMKTLRVNAISLYLVITCLTYDVNGLDTIKVAKIQSMKYPAKCITGGPTIIAEGPNNRTFL